MSHPFLQHHSAAIRELCSRFHVYRLELFGSAARRDDKASSDFDFLVEYEPLAPGQNADSYFGLLFGLEDLLGKKVDLVMVDAITNPYFLEEIGPDRQVVYEHASS
jgi:predicted nucleotidyltransferase